MENLLLPSKVEFQPGDQPNTGSIVIMPCYHGYGATLGNALRRVLLSSLPGAAVESFKIRGVQHEFTTVDGVKEDVVEIMLNLKQLVVKVYSDEPVMLNLSKKNSGMLTAADFESNSNVDIINKDLVIANLTNNKEFEMEVVVGCGRGFRAAEEKNRQNFDLGTIMVDSIYTPVRHVGYHIEFARVGDITNYEKLTVNIETNGTVSPSEAARQATQILMDHFGIIFTAAQEQSNKEAAVARAEEQATEKTKKKPAKKRKITKTKAKTKKKTKK